jgi:signal transduction histidine kinase
VPAPTATRATLPRARFRPRPALLLAYFGTLFALELLAELWLSGQPPMLRVLSRWSLLALAAAPLLGLVAWRGYQADLELAAGAERDLIRGLAARLVAEPADRIPLLLVRQARELTRARAVFLARPLGPAWRVEVVDGETPSNLVGQLLPITADSPGLGGEALREGKPAVLADTWGSEGRASRRELALSDRVRSAAVVPLLVRGEAVGLLGIHAAAVGQLRPDHGELLALYAEQAAGPFHNALLSASVAQLGAVKQLDQLKTEFLSAVAHELRTPLGPIVGWSELLLTHDYSPAEARPILESIHEAAQHLSVLVSDLLDLSRGETGRLALDLQELDLNELLERAVARWREQAPNHGFVFASAGPLPLRGDRHRLRQILDNLLSNAIKYSPAGTRVFVTARTDPNRTVAIRVSDQGIGLTPDERAQLFEKFYRTEPARQRATGTGLGLALCRLISQAHGGEIQVESDGRDHGAAFTVRLPVDGPPTNDDRPGADFATIRAAARPSIPRVPRLS